MNYKRHSPPRFSQFLLAIIAGLAVLILTPAARAQVTTVEIDPAQTKITFSLSGTMHTVHGRFTLKSGTIRFDTSTGKMEGEAIADATSGESGNGGRDARMHREILESAKFPEIVFTPVQMTGRLAETGDSNLQISGRFRLLGQDHDVTLPVDVTAEGRNLQIAAHINIPYVQWGLKNPSNFFLRVSETVAIEIHAVGRLQSGDMPHP